MAIAPRRRVRAIAPLALILVAAHAPPPPRSQSTAPGPAITIHPPIAPGPWLPAENMGSPVPARAALAVQNEVWIATGAGILRFDRTINHPIGRIHNLPAPGVNALTHSGNEILAATDAGLAHLTPDGQLQSIEFRGIRTTAIAPPFIGTARGLYQIGGDTPIPPTETLSITALARFHDSLYLGTQSRGLLRLDGARIIPSAWVSSLTVDARADRLLVATDTGLFTVDRRGLAHATTWKRHTTTVAAGRRRFAGTFGEGIIDLDRTTPPILPHASVTLLHPLENGALLAGTDEALFLVDAHGHPTRLPLTGPPPGLITALAADGDNVWAGSFDRGLAEFDGKNWCPIPLFEPRITALLTDEHGALFIGTADGLARLDPGPGAQPRRVLDPRGWLRFHVSALRRNGPIIWAAAHPGLVAIDTAQRPPAFRYLGARGHDADAGLAGPRVAGFDLDGDDLWTGGDDGLTHLQNGRARILRDLGGLLPDDWINDVRVEQGRVDILTQRDGLLRIAPDRATAFRFPLATSPSAMQHAGGAVVFGTNGAGLAALFPTEDRARVLTFGPARGLGSRTVAALHYDAARDRLLVGGDGGIDRIEGAGARLRQFQQENSTEKGAGP